MKYNLVNGLLCGAITAIVFVGAIFILYLIAESQYPRPGITLEQAFTRGCDTFLRAYNCNQTDFDSVIVSDYPSIMDKTPFINICKMKGYDTPDACARACGCRIS